MKQYTSLVLGIGLFALALIVPTVGAHEAADIKVSGVWAGACEDDNTLAVYMMVDNTEADHPIALLDATSPSVASVGIAEVGGNCAEGTIDRAVVPTGEAVSLWDENIAVVLEMAEDYVAGAPFNMTLTFDMLTDDLTSNGNQIELMVGVPVLEDSPSESALVIDAGSVWARPTVAEMDMAMDESSDDEGDDMEMMDMGGGTSIVYMTITNPTDTDDALVGATSEITDVIEIHETTMGDNDVMMMRPIEGGIAVPANGEADLQPGGFHVMLIDPQPMVAGETITVTLEFASGETITIAAPIEDRLLGDMMMDMDMDSHGDDHNDG